MAINKQTLIEMRKNAAHRHRRIIMNTDGGDTFSSPPQEPKTPRNFLKNRVGGLVGSQVDTILDCTAGTFCSLDLDREEANLSMGGGPVSESWVKALKDQGFDGLQLKIDFGHKNAIEVFRSFRMNDTHDAKLPHLLSPWKKKHPECLMGKQGEEFLYGGGRWSALDYERPEVRDKVFRIIEDTCNRYNIDGIEMDFFRHPHFFKPQMIGDQVTQEHCDLMTDLVRRIRKMIDKVSMDRGHPLLILARVFDSPDYSKAVGLDVTRWMEEDLIDIVAGGGYIQLETWDRLAELGRRYGVPAYAAISASRLKRSNFLEEKSLIQTGGWMTDKHPLFRPIWRGEAANSLKAGVSGIYTFNLHYPGDELFHQMGSLETLEGLEAIYEFNPGIQAEYWIKGGSGFVRHP